MKTEVSYDVIIIGAGVSGAAAAMELSRYDASICVLEKAEDVCCGTSKANSAIVHAGFDAEPGSLMAELNVIGADLIPKLAKDLDFEYSRIGTLVVETSIDDPGHLEELYERGIKNGVRDLSIIGRDELVKLEPNISDQATRALYAPTAGIVCPFGMNIAFAENAYDNGVMFRFNAPVEKIEKTDNGWKVTTPQGVFTAAAVVNAAGVYADTIHNMVSEHKMTITPRKGEYLLLDRKSAGTVSHTIFQLPDRFGKGVLVSPTVHGNTLVGPTADDIENKDGTDTTASGLEAVQTRSAKTVKNVPYRTVIRSFAGLRAHEEHHDFIIGEVEDAPNFVDCAAIESPGLTASPAIGRMVASIVAGLLGLNHKDSKDVITTRKGIIRPNRLSFEERNELIKAHPAYGNIICRCESVSEGEIIDSIRRPLGATTLDGVKKRTRAGMGRCQAGFCSPRVMEIIARELGISLEDVRKNAPGSYIVKGEAREGLTEETNA